MKIGILGGTGNMGRGLTIRWALKHDILVGSRSLDKARTVAKEQENIARGFYQTDYRGSITGVLNSDAIAESEALVVALPSDTITQALAELRTYMRTGQTLISTVVSMKKTKGLFTYAPINGNTAAKYQGLSAAEVIQAIVKPVPVVSAFQTVPATYLNNLDSVMNLDVLVASNHDTATVLVSKLVSDIPNLRALNVGSLENSRLIESLTPLLLNAAILNNLHDPSIRVVPWIPAAFEK